MSYPSNTIYALTLIDVYHSLVPYTYSLCILVKTLPLQIQSFIVQLPKIEPGTFYYCKVFMIEMHTHRLLELLRPTG